MTSARTRSAKLVVCATGDLAIPVLEAVTEAGHQVVRILARAGRDEEICLPEERQGAALARWAKGRDIVVRRPSLPGDDRSRRRLEELAPDLGLVVAYGRSFPVALLDVPRRGWLAVHFSLLPKNRGRHAIRATIWNGESFAGATVIRVTEEADAGPILAQEKLSVGGDETFGELAPRVAELGAGLVEPAIRSLLGSRSPKTRAQNEKAATTTPRFGERHRRAPWWLDADAVYARQRALTPQPGMTTRVGGREVRILQGAPASHIESMFAEAGSFVGLRSGAMAILCGSGTVFSINRVHPKGGRPMNASRFVRYHRISVGTVLV